MIVFFSISVLAISFPVIAGSAACPSSSDGQQLTAIMHQADVDLRTDVMPFWTRSTWDDHGGGFLTEVDRNGKPQVGKDKYMAAECGMVWTLSAAQAYGLTGHGYLPLAGRGVDFIVNHMWDSQYSGWYTSLKPSGEPDDTSKSTYVQAAAIHALSEYALVAHDRHSLDWAERTYALLKSRATDGGAGFHEAFDRSWHPLPGWVDQMHHETARTLRTHLEIMAALTSMVHATEALDSPGVAHAYRVDLASLTDLIVDKAINKRYKCAMDPFDRDWKPLPDRQDRLTTYFDEDTELAWRLLDAYQALHRPREWIAKTFFGLVDTALDNAFDNYTGGFGKACYYGRPIFHVDEFMWDNKYNECSEQANAMIALTEAYAWSRDAKYLTALKTQWHWIWSYQIDRQGGDWFSKVRHSGAPDPEFMDKGMDDVKTCEQNGRCLIRVVTTLRTLLRTQRVQRTAAEQGST